MIETLISIVVEIADFFIDLWINKITSRKKADKGSRFFPRKNYFLKR